MIKKRIFVTIIFIIFCSNMLAQQKSVVPDWFLHPKQDKDCESFYAVGISDLNGSLEKKKEISLNRAILNLAMLYRCKISYMLKDFVGADANFASVVINVTVENIPSRNDITVKRRWIEKDGHLYTEVKTPINNNKNTANTALIKYFCEEHSSDNSEIDKYLLNFSNTAIINKDSIYERYSNSNGVIDFQNIYIEHNSDFKEWFGKSSVPEWFLNPPTLENKIIGLGQGRSPNLYLANKFALIYALSDLSREKEAIIQSMLKDFLKETGDSSYTSGNDLEFLNDISKRVNNTALIGITIAERSVGIDKRGNFEVYILIEESINWTILEEFKKKRVDSLHRVDSIREKALKELEDELNKKRVDSLNNIKK